MIITVTLNTAIDKAYHMEHGIAGGTVMRVKQVCNTAGGKGLNVARAIKLCGERVLATGIAGGFNGRYLESLLNADGIPHDFLQVESETRSCINILDSRFGSTEFLEPGFEVSRAEEAAFLKHFRSLIEKSDMVTISGSAPRGMSSDIYAQMIAMVKAANKPALLDTSGKLLMEGLQAKPTVIKPNQEELEALLGVKINGMNDVAACAERLFRQGIPHVIVSLGKEGAILACEPGIYHVVPPRINAVNTVGCGDSMVGGFAVALLRGDAPSEALKYAVAVASAGAMNEGTGSFDPQKRDKLLEQITVNKINI